MTMSENDMQLDNSQKSCWKRKYMHYVWAGTWARDIYPLVKFAHLIGLIDNKECNHVLNIINNVYDRFAKWCNAHNYEICCMHLQEYNQMVNNRSNIITSIKRRQNYLRNMNMIYDDYSTSWSDEMYYISQMKYLQYEIETLIYDLKSAHINNKYEDYIRRNMLQEAYMCHHNMLKHCRSIELAQYKGLECERQRVLNINIDHMNIDELKQYRWELENIICRLHVMNLCVK